MAFMLEAHARQRPQGLALVRWGRTLPNLSRPVRMALLLPCAALALQRVVYGQSSPFLYFQF